jgi:uncharacterized protein (TIGR02246 family)
MIIISQRSSSQARAAPIGIYGIVSPPYSRIRVRGIYEQAMRFYNAGDLDGLADAYTEDAVLVSPNGTVQGRTAIREHWSQEKAAFPDRTLTVNVVVEQGDTIAAEWTWAGTHTGPLVLPDGTELPPTGKRVEGQGMDLAQLRDGKAAVLHQYWDNMAWARQLGLVP